ncbi:MAG: ATP phosphoribosyltransferase [Alphaproteobacteria bacterium]|nr:ATP phosphoribosyltransferase [Alphaproteobacteria bacterium]
MTRLSIAIPSKGRLKENTEDWLVRSGFKLRQKGGGRGYTATLQGLPDADVMLLSAREIAEGLISGALHVGVTGEDLLNDLSSDTDRDIQVMRRLGFGGADAVVAVPAAWLDVDTMADLEAAGALFRARHGRRMRVATKYMRLTRRFFAQRSVGEYRLIESAGATEAAPAAGTAELIVDITSTGATLKANGLKILSDGVILKSEASLTGSRRADWSESSLACLRVLLDGVEASAGARAMRRLETARPIPPALAEALELQLMQSGIALCPADKATSHARTLAERGLGSVAITTVDHVFAETNPVYEAFVNSLSQSA